ncbi:MAG: phosphatase PAP2 family protein, partial [Rhodospirillales bacterium]|nr:phosphatase PAP2 family protein [Rhodospirillales bacterium]
KSVPPVLFALALAVAALGAAAWWMRRTLLGVTPRIAAYVLGSLLIGPGLIVNVLLKDHWGRARPSQIVDFGGGARFSPALWLSDQCTDNCSFASGHGALGFWVLCFALLAPPRWRGWAVAAALAFGTAMSVTRIAQGGHFLSDVAFSGAITVAVIVVLHRWLVGKRL